MPRPGGGVIRPPLTFLTPPDLKLFKNIEKKLQVSKARQCKCHGVFLLNKKKRVKRLLFFPCVHAQAFTKTPNSDQNKLKTLLEVTAISKWFEL